MSDDNTNPSLNTPQPEPLPTTGRLVWEMVIWDMKERDSIGRERYGTPLQVDNGRDALIDAYQEQLDHVVYLRQEIERRRLPLERIATLAQRIMDLETAIRRHRDYRGDDRCHLDDGELYSFLPEGDTRPAKDTAVTIENCYRYITCRQQGREYISPQRRIEELEAENTALRQLNTRHCDRIAAQSALLSKKADKPTSIPINQQSEWVHIYYTHHIDWIYASISSRPAV